MMNCEEVDWLAGGAVDAATPWMNSLYAIVRIGMRESILLPPHSPDLDAPTYNPVNRR